VTPLQVAQKFVERINAADVAGLATLMTDDHRFIDSLGNVVNGREAMRAGWVGYFGMVPDYRLTAEQWLCDGPVVVMLGTSGGTYSPDGTLQPERRWTTPLAGRATVRGDLVAEWRVYADNEPIRQLMRANS
jgi:ketosteroid isomerase-like protein